MRTPESLADLGVAPLVDARLGKHPGLETNLGGKRRRFVEPLHRGQQDWPLIGGWQQLQLERKLHAPIVG